MTEEEGEKSRSKKKTENKSGPENLKSTALFAFCYVFAGDRTLIAGRKLKRGGSRSTHPVCPGFQQRRVNPRAASGGGAWEDAPPVFMRVQMSFPAIPGVFRDYFVNLKLIHVIFILLF